MVFGCESKVEGERKLLNAKFYGTEKEKVVISSKEQLDQILKEVENAEYSVADIKKGERVKKAPDFHLPPVLCSRRRLQGAELCDGKDDADCATVI